MKLSSKKTSNFTPCPEYTGAAICVDVTEPREVETTYGKKRKFNIVFEVPVENPSFAGENYTVRSSGFTESLHEKAGLRKFLKQWFGRDLNAQELDEFDTETLIGKPAFVVVTHSQSDDGEKTYANIAACTPLKGQLDFAPCGKYVRTKDREPKDGAKTAGGKAEYRKAEAEPESSRDDWQKCKVHVGRHKGVEVGDLDETAIKSLVENWLPKAKSAAKPTADDKRLIHALEAALKELESVPAGEDEATDY